MDFKFLNDSILATQDEKGKWIYKANPEYALVPFKKDGTLRQSYKDMPRFDAIIEAESKFMREYDKELKDSVLEMSQVLSTFGK